VTQNTQQSGRQPLLGLRSAIVLLLGVLTGIGAGVLTYLAQRSLPAAVLAVGAAFGAGVLFFHTIIG
jgi:drug/metabolite transporter (DMT)-like permease